MVSSGVEGCRRQALTLFFLMGSMLIYVYVVLVIIKEVLLCRSLPSNGRLAIHTAARRIRCVRACPCACTSPCPDSCPDSCPLCSSGGSPGRRERALKRGP